jgi:DNA-directed RNA polymerase II subunit RPB1
LGVPIKIAMNLTFPEFVTPENIDHLTKLVRKGRDEYPGANYVFPASDLEAGKRILPISLKYRKESVELRYGDIVERHLVDGDIVLLNRQPTLHKQSMMGHRIKVINDPLLNTFRLII